MKIYLTQLFRHKTGKAIFLFFLVFAFPLAATVAFAQEVPAEVGKPLPAWKEGYLDLHHINTGRGSAAFYIFPDGTNMLFDAGEIPPTDSRVFTPRNSAIRPGSQKLPYEWIVHYIRKVAPAGDKTGIDYALTSHFHDDHFGAWYSFAPLSASRKFIMSGITGVGEKIHIRSLVDRAAPAYNYPYDFRRSFKNYSTESAFPETIKNYWAFIEEKAKSGMTLNSFIPGSKKQFILKNSPASYTNFVVQNVKSNGMVWTGKGEEVKSLFPPVDSLRPETWPNENSLSLALTINYGPFTYYTGGDNAGNLITGDNPLRDVETHIASAIGEVDVATLDHHGNRDGVNEFMVRTFKPRVWIGQSWSSDHPGHEVLLRLTNKHIYPDPRDLFATNMLEANRIVIGPLIDRSYKSQQGHILVRVSPGGSKYHVIILDDSTPDMPVKAVFGPYIPKSKKTF